MNTTTAKNAQKKQPWGPFIKQVLGPNVPWAWYIGNMVVGMLMANAFIKTYELSGRIAAGEIFDNGLLFQYIGLQVLSLLYSLVMSFSGQWANIWTDRKIQNRIWTKMVHMPMRLYDRQDPSTLISRVTSDVDGVTYTVAYIFTVAQQAYALCLMLGTIWKMDYRITLALLCVLPYIFVVMYIPGRFKFRFQAAVRQKMAAMTSFVAERLSNITLVKSAANERADLELNHQVALDYYKARLKMIAVEACTQPFSYSTEAIVGAIILVSGSILVQNGQIETADLMTMFMMRFSIYIYMLQFIFFFHNLKETQGSTAKVAEIMSSQPEVMERKESFTQPDADIAFENVSFRYDDAEVLKNVSFVIPQGKVTAIVGPSGAGKTTLLSLLERLYQPNGGCLKFGDTPVENIHLNEWRGATGYIQQASPLLSGTIRDNIAYGVDGSVTDAEIIAAAKKARAYDFIMKLPQGFDTEVGQLGGKLSGGERQRIAIARMIVKDPAYLLLDEATSNLDAENEAEVQAALNAMMDGRTAVVVAHNLRTVVNADNIVVMDQGKVQAVGTHETLYKSNALYKKYFDLQFAQ